MFRKRQRRKNLQKVHAPESVYRGLSSFEKLLGFSTLAISSAALMTATYQVYLEQRAFDIAQRDLLPNIVAQNEYYPFIDYTQEVQQPFLPQSNNVRLYSDLNFVNNISIDSVSFFAIDLFDQESLERFSVTIPFDGYFSFCNVSVEPDAKEFAACIGQDNSFEQDRLPASLNYNDPLIDEIYVHNARFFSIFKVEYETLLMETGTEYIRINNFGVVKGADLHQTYEENESLYSRGVNVSKSTSPDQFRKLIVELILEHKKAKQG